MISKRKLELIIFMAKLAKLSFRYFVVLMQKTKFEKIGKTKGGPLEKSKKTKGVTLGKIENQRGDPWKIKNFRFLVNTFEKVTNSNIYPLLFI